MDKEIATIVILFWIFGSLLVGFNIESKPLATGISFLVLSIIVSNTRK